MIELGDLNRLANEMRRVEEDGLSPRKWCEKNDLDWDAVIAMLGIGMKSIRRANDGELERKVEEEIALVLGKIFKIGWEACREYGRSGSDV